MEGPYFLLSLYLLLTIARLISCNPTFDSDNYSGGDHYEANCIQLDSALRYMGKTYLFSNGVSFQLDENYTEVNRYRIEDYWGDIEPVEAAMSFGYDAYLFKDTVNYHYSWFHGMEKPVENEDSWGEKTNGGVTAAATFNGDMAAFFYHCRYYIYVVNDGIDGTNSLRDIGLPCEVDAAFRLEGDKDGRIAVVKFDKMWYMAANESVEGPVDVNSLIKLKNDLTICNEDDSSHARWHLISKRSAGVNKSYKDFWKKKNWKAMFGSESESEEESESTEKRHERQLVRLLNKLLDDRFGHGSENETMEERYEREVRLAKLKSWVRHEITDEESNESDESFDSDSSSRSKELEYFKEMSLKRPKRHIHGRFHKYGSETESEEQRREQAKEMFEQEMELREEKLEQLKEQKHKHHGVFRRETQGASTKMENKMPGGEKEEERIEKELEQLEQRGQELGQLYQNLEEDKYQQDGEERQKRDSDDCICDDSLSDEDEQGRQYEAEILQRKNEMEERRREYEAEKLQQRMERDKEWLAEKHEQLENRLEQLKQKGTH